MSIRRSLDRLFLYGVLLPLGVAAGTAVGVYRYDHRVDRSPAGNVHHIPTLPAAPTMGGWRIPLDARVDVNGLVTVVCQPAAGAAGYMMRVPRGSIVRCSNGAIPHVVG